MRTIDSAALAKLATNFGTEPVTIIEIQWVDGGQRFQYADKDINSANIKGKIIQMGALDDVAIITGATQSTASSASVNVVLDDIDGAIKSIVDHNDIHLRPCWVYQWFEGLDISNKFLIFKGEINTPITWTEGDRTISFTVLSAVEDQIVGFSIEQGNFVIADPSLIGKAWPLCFGTVTNVPCARLTPSVSGILSTGTGIADPSLPVRIHMEQQKICPIIELTALEGGGNQATGVFFTTEVKILEPDPQCEKDICNNVSNWTTELAYQRAYETPTITVFNGERFPQHTPLVLQIGEALFDGSFNGELFTITARVHPNNIYKFNTLPSPTVILPQTQCQQTINYYLKWGDASNEVNWGGLVFRGIWSPTTSYQMFDMVEYQLNDISYRYVCASANLGFPPTNTSYWGQLPKPLSYVTTYIDFYNALAAAIPQASFFWANAGESVTIWNGQKPTFIANILPSTILRVAAYRQLAAGPTLVTVPPEFYTVEVVDYTGYQMTQITFDVPLSSYGAGWQDDNIYVSLTSSVGPNTVDILTWIIETYSQHGIDSVSFDHVKTLVDNYPMHFALLELKDLMTILKEIAYQARCAIMLDDDVFRLVYLSEEPTSVDTISDSDVLLQPTSLTLYHTPTEDLVTQYTVTYRDDYAASEPYTLIYRYNINKYRLRPATDDFYCYNVLDLVRKSASFWLLRRANTWRLVSLSTPLTKLNIEVGDCVTLNLTDVAPSPVKAIVTKAAYNSDARMIDFELWTPLRSGDTTQYVFAWPADISETLVFPTPDDLEKGFASGGIGPNFITTPPFTISGGGGGGGGGGGFSQSGSPGMLDCNGQFVRMGRLGSVLDPGDFPDGQCHNDRGQKKPSDRGDTKPTPKSSEDDSSLQASSTPNGGSGSAASACCQDAKDLAQKAMDTAQNALELARGTDGASGGGGGGNNPDDPNDLTGKVPDCNQAKTNNNCTFTVEVEYATPTEVFSADKGFSTKPGDSGNTITTSTGDRTSSTVFESQAGADEFFNNCLSQINKQLETDGSYSVGTEVMVHVSKLYSGGTSDNGTSSCGNTASKKIIGYCKDTG